MHDSCFSCFQYQDQIFVYSFLLLDLIKSKQGLKVNLHPSYDNDKRMYGMCLTCSYQVDKLLTQSSPGRTHQNCLFGMISEPVAWNLTRLVIAPRIKYATTATIILQEFREAIILKSVHADFGFFLQSKIVQMMTKIAQFVHVLCSSQDN